MKALFVVLMLALAAFLLAGAYRAWGIAGLLPWAIVAGWLGFMVSQAL